MKNVKEELMLLEFLKGSIQKGFTTTKITIKINRIVGTSLMYLKYLEVYFDGSLISFFRTTPKYM